MNLETIYTYFNLTPKEIALIERETK